MNRISGIKVLVALAAICLVTATVANAAIVEIRLNLTTSTGAALPGAQYSGPGGTFTGAAGTYRVQIQVRIANNVLFNDGTNDYIGGLAFIGYDMLDSTGIVSPGSLLAPSISSGKWTTTANAALTDKGNGLANTTKAGVDYDVLQGFAGIGPDDLGIDGQYNYDVGGSGQAGIPMGTQPAWVTAVYGNFIYSGGNAVLSLQTIPASLKVFTGGGTSGYESPTSVNLSLATLTFGAVVTNTPPTKPTVNPTEVLESSWTKEPGWNNLLHSVQITASSTDADSDPLTYLWTMTGGGKTNQPLTGETGSVLNLTLQKLFDLGFVLPDKPGETWMLTVKAFDGKDYSVGTDIPVFVPEPATIGLLAFGVVGLLRRRRRA
jgi:hypothetical protein